jgi:hypothetical protein
MRNTLKWGTFLFIIMMTQGAIAQSQSRQLHDHSQSDNRRLEIDRGAKIRVMTANAEAVKAVHEFLRFQIQDHQTGDSTEVEKGQF